MNSKSLLFFALLCALLLLVSSTLAADTQTTPQQDEGTNEDNTVKEPGQYGGGCAYGCCRWVGHRGICRSCCKSAAEAAQVNGWGGGGGKGGGGGGQHCSYGCCGGHGRYCRCCYNPEEAQNVHFGN